MRIFATLAGLLFSVLSFADNQAPMIMLPYLEGRDYTLLSEPVPTADPSKIEVVEVFAYTCPHCYHFEPLLRAWLSGQKPDVALAQMHTKWSKPMEAYQRGFATMIQLKVKEKAHLAVFQAYHEQHKELPDAQAWADFLAPYGVSKQTVLSTFDSAAITAEVAKLDQLTRRYQIRSTPEMVIDGKYHVSISAAGGPEEMLKVAQFLVNKARSEHAAKH